MRVTMTKPIKFQLHLVKPPKKTESPNLLKLGVRVFQWDNGRMPCWSTRLFKLGTGSKVTEPRVHFAHYRTIEGIIEDRVEANVIVDYDNPKILDEYGCETWAEFTALVRRMYAGLCNVIVFSSYSGKTKMAIGVHWDMKPTNENRERLIKSIIPERDYKYVDFGSVAMNTTTITQDLVDQIEAHGRDFKYVPASEMMTREKQPGKWKNVEIEWPEDLRDLPQLKKDIILDAISTQGILDFAYLSQPSIAARCGCSSRYVSDVLRNSGLFSCVRDHYIKGKRPKAWIVTHPGLRDQLEQKSKVVSIFKKKLPPLLPGTTYANIPTYVRKTIDMDFDTAVEYIMGHNQGNMGLKECIARVKSLRRHYIFNYERKAA